MFEYSDEMIALKPTVVRIVSRIMVGISRKESKMTQSQRKKMIIERRQAILKKRAMHNAIFNGIMIILIMLIGLYISVNAQPKVNESEANIDYHLTVGVASILEKDINQSSSVEEVESIETYPEFEYSKDWDANDSYLLAKIAMCEAGNQNTQTKTLVIMTILNRVWDDYFPDTIEEVIFQQGSNGVYQFSPIGDGSWEKNEPDEDCWEAVRIVMESRYDYSDGALYFESYKNEDNWHSRNLEFLYQSQAMRFYK